MSQLLDQVRGLSEDEDVPEPARNTAKAFLRTAAYVDDIYLHRLVRALEDCRRGFGSVESVVLAVRLCSRMSSESDLALIRKDFGS